MDFNTFLSTIRVPDKNGLTGATMIDVQEWMTEIRGHDNVILSVPRQIGSSTYTRIGALYDILFTDVINATIITHHGGYRKKHCVDALLTLYSWMMRDLQLDRAHISHTESSITIHGHGSIEVIGMNNMDIELRGRTNNIGKLYADISVPVSAEIPEILLHTGQKRVLFFQGIRCHTNISNIFNQYYNMDDMEKVHRILKGDLKWHAIKVKHNLSKEEMQQLKQNMGDEMFSLEYEV